MDTLSMKVLYRGFEKNEIICDITWDKPRTATVKDENGENKIVKVPAPKTDGARIKIADNAELIDKIKGLRRRRLIWITYLTDFDLGTDTKNMTVIQVLTNDEYLERYIPYKKAEDEFRRQNQRNFKKYN